MNVRLQEMTRDDDDDIDAFENFWELEPNRSIK
jgi:hypothetical protein